MRAVQPNSIVHAMIPHANDTITPHDVVCTLVHCTLVMTYP
jgi:hypothetical protein